jgi:quercetin dioxygenase-like cupin family protein
MNTTSNNNSNNHLPGNKMSNEIKVSNLNPVADSQEMDKAKPMITVEIIEYVDKSVVIKTIMKKTSGNISVMSVDTGEGLAERTSPFDTFVQVIDGKVELVINTREHLLKTGGSIIIPANAPYSVNPDGRFKMILTIIKSAYE